MAGEDLLDPLFQSNLEYLFIAFLDRSCCPAPPGKLFSFLQFLIEARLAGKKEAIFGGRYLVDISVRRPNIDQVLPYQQEGEKISPHRTNGYRTLGTIGTMQTLCQPWHSSWLSFGGEGGRIS